MALQLEDRIKNSADYIALTEKPYGNSPRYKETGQDLISYFKSFSKPFNTQEYTINAGNYRLDKESCVRQERYKSAEQPGYNAKNKDATGRDLSNIRYNADIRSYFNPDSFNNKWYTISPSNLEKKFEIPSRYFIFDKPKHTEIFGQEGREGSKTLAMEYTTYLAYKKINPELSDDKNNLASGSGPKLKQTSLKDMRYFHALGKKGEQDNSHQAELLPLNKVTGPADYTLFLQRDPQTYRVFTQDSNSKPFEDISKRIDALIDEVSGKKRDETPEITMFPVGGFPLSSVDGLAKLAASYSGKSSAYSGSKSSGSSSAGSSGSSGGSGGK